LEDDALRDAGSSTPDVFLSYAREDEARAGELATALDQHGFSVFWDREVPPGQTWQSYIGQALVGARCVVVAWSRHSILSEWVIEEANEGKRRKVLVPVQFEAVQPPFGFAGIQVASLVDWDPGRPSPAFDALLGAVRRIVGGRSGSGTEPATQDRPSPKPTTLPPPRTSRRSYRSLAVMAAGVIAVAGAGSAGIYWWQTHPVPSPAPELPRPLAEAGRPTPESAQPKSTAEAEPSMPELAPSEVRDCEQCPVMVMVPAGEFTMGARPNEGSAESEGPRHKVTIAHQFAVGKYEVTFAQWDACVAAGGCRHEPDDQGWGRGDLPVIM
jgi:hypothetical protein